jgi:hypothetical protein
MRSTTTTSSTVTAPITTVADEVLVLWPPGGTSTWDSADLWPVFVVVVADEPALPLLAPEDGSAEVSGDCRWSVADTRAGLLRMDVHTTADAGQDVEIILSARCFLGVFDIVARGATVGVTASRRARRFTARPDHEALDGIVLLGSRTSRDLAELAAALCRVPGEA